MNLIILFLKQNVQDMKIKELKFEAQGTFKKNENITTNFQPLDDEDVINKAYPDEKIKNTRSLINIRKRLQLICITL